MGGDVGVGVWGGGGGRGGGWGGGGGGDEVWGDGAGGVREVRGALDDDPAAPVFVGFVALDKEPVGVAFCVDAERALAGLEFPFLEPGVYISIP